MNTQVTLLIQSLGWALLHSLWQVLLIYCCLRIVLKISGSISSRAKYHLSVAAMAGSFVWFINTCISQYQRLQGVTIQVTQSGNNPSLTKSYSITTLPTDSYSGQLLNSIIVAIEPYFPLLVGLYVAGVLFLMLRLVVNLFQIKGLRTKGLTSVDSYWTEWLQQWQSRLDISRKVTLLLSNKINVPMTMGALKPIILLPIASMSNLSQNQLEAILLHELAHIKRHDYLLNILQTIVETILFFNPFVWLTSRIIRKEREHCCDDVVLTHFSTPLPYAKALATLEAYRADNSIALAANTGNKNQLLNRIKRIMEMKKKPVNYTQFGIAAVLILALLVSVAWFSPTFAQTKKVVKKEKKGSVNVTSSKNNKVITRTVTINSDVEGKATGGVHPNDVGNQEHVDQLIKEALAQVDWKSIGDDVDKAMAEVNWNDISKDVQVAIAKVDGDKLSKEVSVAINGVNWGDINDQMRNAHIEIENINWDEVGKSIDDAMAQIDDPKIRKQIEIELDNAKNGKSNNVYAYSYSNGDGKSKGKAKVFTYADGDYDDMLEKMEDDGLIDRSKKYTITKDSDELYINGKKQPASVVKKYSDYIGDAEQVSISGSKGNLSISVQK